MKEGNQPHELLANLRSWRERSGVQTAFFDLDDTLIHSSSLFREHIYRYASLLAARLAHNGTVRAQQPMRNGGHQDISQVEAAVSGQPTPEEIAKFFIETLSGLRHIYAVSPSVISEAARITALRYDADPLGAALQEARKNMLHELYNGHNATPIVGARDTVDMLQAAGVSTVLVTHASEPYTERKLAKTGLGARFEHRFCIDDHGTKDSLAWQHAFESMGVVPEAGLVVGDNWESDIKPALELGVPVAQVVRVMRPGEAGDDLHRNFYKQTQYDEVAQIPSVEKLIDHLLSQ